MTIPFNHGRSVQSMIVIQNMLSLHPETAAFLSGMALRQIRVLARLSRIRRMNRAPPLRRPFLVPPTFSLAHPLRSAPIPPLPRL